MKQPQPPQFVAKKPTPRRVARCFVIYEDTEGDAPRTWSFGTGLVDLEHVVLESTLPQCNSEAVCSYALRAIDELDLLSSTREGV